MQISGTKTSTSLTFVWGCGGGQGFGREHFLATNALLNLHFSPCVCVLSKFIIHELHLFKTIASCSFTILRDLRGEVEDTIVDL